MKLPEWRNIHTIAMDFDGVFTNNLVYTNDSGHEIVACSRADGLGLDILRKFCILKSWDVRYFILSKEKNAVVGLRAQKLKIECFQGIDDKREFLELYLSDARMTSQGLVYLGNDLNDLPAMNIPGVFSIVPSDSHPMVSAKSNLMMPVRGGDGFVRYCIEKLIGLEMLSDEDLLYLL